MKNWLCRLPRSSVFLVLATGFLVGMSGCGETKPPENFVSGKVFFNKNVPVPYGTVRFFNDKGMIGKSLIRSDGSYSIANVPEGEVKICVRAEPPKSGSPMDQMTGGGKGMPPGMKNWKPEDGKPPPRFRPPIVKIEPDGRKSQSDSPRAIPVNPELKALAKKIKKFNSPKTTTLTFVIQAGEQTHDIILPSS
jgi:hypothetical protein